MGYSLYENNRCITSFCYTQTYLLVCFFQILNCSKSLVLGLSRQLLVRKLSIFIRKIDSLKIKMWTDEHEEMYVFTKTR